MFTTKPESGEKITKLAGGGDDAKTPFTERPQPTFPKFRAQVRAGWSRQLSART